MREAYCGTIGYQIEHLLAPAADVAARHDRDRLASKPLEPDEKQLLDRLIQVFGFERYLEKAYLGQKMFSLEGLDTVVPMLDEVFEMATPRAPATWSSGWPTGDGSVLAHNIGRPVEAILAEFEGAKAIEAVKSLAAIPTGGTGDVKYHYGHGGSYETREDIEIRSALSEPEPSGVRRSRGHRRRPGGPDPPENGHLEHDPMVAVPVLLHGDAAFPAQGLSRRRSTSSRWKGYRPAAPSTSSRTTRSDSRPIRGGAFDLVRGRHGEGLQRPDHPRVNADDPEACLGAVRLAMAYGSAGAAT